MRAGAPLHDGGKPGLAQSRPGRIRTPGSMMLLTTIRLCIYDRGSTALAGDVAPAPCLPTTCLGPALPPASR